MNQSLPAREPLITVASITAAIAAVVALLVAFGVPLTEGQQIAILGVVAPLAPLVTAVISRRYVTPASDAQPRHMVE